MIRHWIASVVMVLLAAPLFGADGKPATVTILVPEQSLKEAKVKVDGETVKGVGSTRVFTTPALDLGKKYTCTVEAVIEPTNYIRIFRSRKVTFQSGDAIAVDLSKKDEKFPDDIRIKWVPTPKEVVIELGKLARIGRNDVVCDLGCGDGIMLTTAVKELGARKGIGIDVDPVQLAKANANVKEAGLAERIVIRSGNVLDVSADQIGDADVVMLYMGDEINLRLRPKLWTMLKPGSRIVSHRFLMGDWKPNKSITVKDLSGDEYNLHLWIVSGKEKDGTYDKKEE